MPEMITLELISHVGMGPCLSSIS